jgi:hypothetical protein
MRNPWSEEEEEVDNYIADTFLMNLVFVISSTGGWYD